MRTSSRTLWIAMALVGVLAGSGTAQSVDEGARPVEGAAPVPRVEPGRPAPSPAPRPHRSDRVIERVHALIGAAAVVPGPTPSRSGAAAAVGTVRWSREEQDPASLPGSARHRELARGESGGLWTCAQFLGSATECPRPQKRFVDAF